MHPSDEASAKAFFAKRWPDAKSLADPGRELFRAFGLARAGWRTMFAPRVWRSAMRAVLGGHFVGLPHGDPWQMSGWFLIDGRNEPARLVWQQVHEQPGEERDVDGLRAAFERVRGVE